MIDIEDLASSLVQRSAFSSSPAPPRSLKEVVATGCCMGCGICESIVGSDLVRMELQASNKERIRPVFYGPISRELEDRALAACPGAVVQGVVPEPGVADHPVVGPHISVRHGYASDPETRHKAAAGGGLTSLASYLLESGRVKFVLHVKASVWHGIEEHQGAKLSFSKAEVFEGRGSRYGPVAPLKTINAVLDRNERFAFIGKPCDVNALRNFALIEPRVNELCACAMTISCGSYADNDFAVRFMANNGIARDDVENKIARWRWRGHGCPGKCPSARMVDGRKFHMDYVDYVYSNGLDAGPCTVQWRCKTCPDFLGLEADIVVMDSWPVGKPEKFKDVTPERAHEQEGWVIVMARTNRGEGIVKEAQAAGFLTLSDSDPRHVMNSQPHQMKRQVGLLARRLAHDHEGVPQPALGKDALKRMMRAAMDPSCLYFADKENETVKPCDPSISVTEITTLTKGLNAEDCKSLEAAFRSLSPEHYAFHADNFDGVIKRLKRGDGTEPVQSNNSAEPACSIL